MKKVVVFGGGTGLSFLLSGLKLFPIDVTAITGVSDNGSSTGILKEELDIPAVGDIGKVLISMANVDEDFVKLLKYRFTKESFLKNHPIRNILLAALIDIKGNITDATKYMCELLEIKGAVYPLCEDNIELIGCTKKGKKYIGEEEVSKNAKYIEELKYDKDIKVKKEILEKIEEADLIIFSPGSLYTSILPHLIVPEIKESIKKSEGKIMYISNLVTQPGETDGFTVSNHLNIINKYLEYRKIDVVVANNGIIDKNILKKYSTLEKKELVKIDTKDIEKIDARLIEDKIYAIDEGLIRHDAFKTAYIIFSYLMEGD